MIRAIAKAIVTRLERHGAIRPAERDIYIYGCDTALYTAISTLGLLALGAGFGRLWETVVCVSLFYLNQSFGGGYHADTHLRCFLTMAAGLVIFMLSFYLPLPQGIAILAGYLSLTALYAIPLVLHKNKAYLTRHKEKLIRRSRRISLLQTAVFSLILIHPVSRIIHAYSAALTLCMVSRLTALYRQGREAKP